MEMCCTEDKVDIFQRWMCNFNIDYQPQLYTSNKMFTVAAMYLRLFALHLTL